MFDTNTMESILEGEYGPEDHTLKNSTDAEKAARLQAKQDRQKPASR